MKTIYCDLNALGYLISYSHLPIEGWTEIQVDFQGKEFLEYQEAYKFNGTTLIIDEEKLQKISSESEKEELRILRQECFSIINRGTLWYNTLSQDQILELTQWYNEWLNVTDTKIIPSKPGWLT